MHPKITKAMMATMLTVRVTVKLCNGNKSVKGMIIEEWAGEVKVSVVAAVQGHCSGVLVKGTAQWQSSGTVFRSTVQGYCSEALLRDTVQSTAIRK